MKERLGNIFDIRKKHRSFVSLCVLLAAVCVMSGLAACRGSTTSTETSSGGLAPSSNMEATSSNSNQTCTVEQALNLNLNDVDQIAIENNDDSPGIKFNNKADIQELLKPFLQIRMSKTSNEDNTGLQSKLENTYGGGGLYYVIYQNGKPYMDMQIFKEENLILIHPNRSRDNHTESEFYNTYIFYHAQNPLDTNAIDQLIKKYKL